MCGLRCYNESKVGKKADKEVRLTLCLLFWQCEEDEALLRGGAPQDKEDKDEQIQ